MKDHKLFHTPFATVYPLYLTKIQKKNRTKSELDQVIQFLTGYQDKHLIDILQNKWDFQKFFEQAPEIPPSISEFKGTICGVKIQELEDGLMKKIRILDKLVDDLAKGKSLDHLRSKL